MYWHKNPPILKYLFSSFLWKVNTHGAKEIYLTFDDGPIPGVTEWVLAELEKYNARATFFCVGENISKHPQVYRKVLAAGHRVGNHTYNHLNGWHTAASVYLENFVQCDDAMRSESGQVPLQKPLLFRAPYVRIRKSQYKPILKTHRIVMWDVISGDFDSNLSPELCLANTVKATGPGSIVIFHDSFKAERNMKHALSGFLQHFSGQGYTFKSL